MPKPILGKGVFINKDCWLETATENAVVKIGDGSSLGRAVVIAAANRVTIGDKVLISHNVFIADTQHEYRDVRTPVIDQGITTDEKTITIGDGAWIGANTLIFANVGKQSVIGANSIVLKDVPDYSVAVGNPARVIKTYDFNKEQWV